MKPGKKILDASAAIAFLHDMSCQECFVELSKHCEIFIPDEVENEVKKQPGKQRLQALIRDGVIKVVKADKVEMARVVSIAPLLGKGECAAIAAALTQGALRGAHVVSDDSRARKKFKDISFVWTEEMLYAMRDRGIISGSVYDAKMSELRKSPFYSRHMRP